MSSAGLGLGDKWPQGRSQGRRSKGEPPTDEAGVRQKPRERSDKEPAAVSFTNLGLGVVGLGTEDYLIAPGRCIDVTSQSSTPFVVSVQPRVWAINIRGHSCLG